MMFDNQVSYTGTMGKYNILAGTRSDLVGKIDATGTVFGNAETSFATDAHARIALNALGHFPVVHVNNGANIGEIGIGETVECQEYCINLISMMGTLCNEKYFPLFACTSAPIRLEITLVPSALNTFATDAAASFTLDNVEFVMDCLELADSAVETIKASLQGQALEFALTEYRNINWTGTGTNNVATTHAMPIPAKFSSLKSLFVAMRDNTHTGQVTYFPCSAQKFALSQYYFRIGGSVVPSKFPNSPTEYYSELCKAFGNFGDIRSNPAVDWDAYTQDTIVANNDAVAIYNCSNVNSGAFYIGLDLESYPNADKGQLFAGTNTNSDDIYFYASVTPSGANNTSIRYDCFAAFDQVMRFANNTCYCSY
jgi:hypothetical protein